MTRRGYARVGWVVLALGLVLSCSSDERTSAAGTAAVSGGGADSVAGNANGGTERGGSASQAGARQGGAAPFGGMQAAGEGGSAGVSSDLPGGGDADGGTSAGGDGGHAARGGIASQGGAGGMGNGGEAGSGGESRNPCSDKADLRWAKPIAKLGLGAYVYARGITGLSDSSAVVVGELEGGASVRFGFGTPQEVAVNASGAFWARFDEAGELVTARQLLGAYVNAVGVAPMPDDSFVVGGYFRYSLTFDYGLPSQLQLKTPGTNDQVPFLARVGSDGKVMWALQGSGTLPTIVTQVAVLPNGNIAITGRGTVTFGSGAQTVVAGSGSGFYDNYLAVFSAGGVPLWARSFNVGAPNQLSALDDGSIAITGWFFESATFATAPDSPNVTLSGGDKNFESLFVVRYLGDGTVAWAKRATNRAVGFGVLSGDPGHVLVTGYADPGAVFSPGEPSAVTMASKAMVIADYDTGGSLHGVHTTSNFYSSEADVVRAPTGALVSTGVAFGGIDSKFGGMTTGGPGGADAFTLCQSPSGDFGWVSITGSPQGDSGRAIALLPNGDVVSTGQYPAAATAAYNTAQVTPLPIDLGTLGSYVLRYKL